MRRSQSMQTTTQSVSICSAAALSSGRTVASTFFEVLGLVLNTATLRRSGGAFVAATEQGENDRDRAAGSGLQNGLLMT